MSTQFFQPGTAQTVIPPLTNDPNAIVTHLKALEGWLQGLFTNGLQSTMVTESQLDSIVTQNDFTAAGKIFYTTDTDKFYGIKISGSNLVKKEFAA